MFSVKRFGKEWAVVERFNPPDNGVYILSWHKSREEARFEAKVWNELPKDSKPEKYWK